MTDRREVDAGSLFAQMGGVRGLVDSAVPGTVFVLTRLVTGDLGTAVVVAILSGVALAAVRLRRGQGLQQVGGGFLGLLVAVLVARATGTGEGFFLPGIALTAAWGVVFAVSLLAGRPAVGLALPALDPAYATWRQSPALLRACRIATAFWAVTFFVRAAVALYVYRLDGDNDGLLLVVTNLVKWPLIAVAVVLTVVLVRRAGPPPARPVALVEDGADPL